MYKTAPLVFGTVAPTVISGSLYCTLHALISILPAALNPASPLPSLFIPYRSYSPMDDVCMINAGMAYKEIYAQFFKIK